MVVEYVMISDETGYWIPSKWAVIGSTLTGVDTGFFWIKRISYAIETESNYTDYVTSYNNKDGIPNKSLLKGTLGEYKVIAFSDIVEYKRNSLRTTDMPMSVYPIG